MIIASITLKEYIKYLDLIFNKLAELYITLALNKSYIDFLDVKLLRQCVDSLGMITSEAKLKALLSLKFP